MKKNNVLYESKSMSLPRGNILHTFRVFPTSFWYFTFWSVCPKLAPHFRVYGSYAVSVSFWQFNISHWIVEFDNAFHCFIILFNRLRISEVSLICPTHKTICFVSAKQEHRTQCWIYVRFLIKGSCHPATPHLPKALRNLCTETNTFLIDKFTLQKLI